MDSPSGPNLAGQPPGDPDLLLDRAPGALEDSAGLSRALFHFCNEGILLALMGVPSQGADLQGWKLQIPGPQEVKNLEGYDSRYFGTGKDGDLHFRLDAAEPGATANSAYVRSELRHLAEWPIGEAHALSAEFRVVSRLKPDRVTVLQIHGITAEGENAPPLLRIALNEGDLVAVLKTGPSGEETRRLPLRKALGSHWASVDIRLEGRLMKILVDGQVRVLQDLSYWPHRNYFKAGCYPQAKRGKVEVTFKSLSAR